MCSGRGGERRHGESQTGQQEDSLQPAAGSCGTTLPAVQPQKHGEKNISKQCNQHIHLKELLSSFPGSRVAGSVLPVLRSGGGAVCLHSQLQRLLHRAGWKQHGCGVSATAQRDHCRL